MRITRAEGVRDIIRMHLWTREYMFALWRREPYSHKDIGTCLSHSLAKMEDPSSMAWAGCRYIQFCMV